MAMPSFCATARTASGKVMLSSFCTKLKTSFPRRRNEAVIELPRGMHGKRSGLFLVKWHNPVKFLRARSSSALLIAHDADDIGLLLDRV